MKCRSAFYIMAVLMLPPSTCLSATGQLPLDLRRDAPPCKAPKAKLPKLGVDVSYDAPVALKADFNGDGWCDHALAVPYPLNSRMKAYDLNQLMALGQPRGWRPVFKGKKAFQLAEDGYVHSTWPTFRVDLTDVKLVFPAQKGAPFVVGLFAGLSDEGKRDMGNGCQQFRSVHRWDEAIGTFRKVDEATRKHVLNYFYSAIEQPCRTQ